MEFISRLGFKPKNGCNNIYYKKYNSFNQEFKIIFDESNVKNSKICYKDLGIKVCRETTSNFLQGENLVVLECVNRLLEKGYLPENIVLEKDWGLGHKTKGNLDIEIVQDDKAVF